MNLNSMFLDFFIQALPLSFFVVVGRGVVLHRLCEERKTLMAKPFVPEAEKINNPAGW